MNERVRKIWNGVTTVLVVAAVLLSLLLVAARLVGLQVYTVLSGSMEPVYPVGALLYVKETDPFTLESGDVITFLLNEDTVATHRIVEVVPDESDPGVVRFRTKGDANDSPDGALVHYRNVIGTPVFSIPCLGYVANYIQHPPGTYVTISAGAILILLVFVPDLLARTEDRGEKGKPEDGDETPPETK